MKPRYYIQTFGCQMNVHDSERMAGMLEELGYEYSASPVGADVVLVNTCAVRERPEHKLYSELGDLRKLKTQTPHLVLGVAGCMAQREAEGIRARVPEVDILLGPRNLHHLPHLVRETQRRFAADNRREYSGNADGLDLFCDPTPVTPVKRGNSISAYVDIIFGCNFNCTYCAVPSARGREVSRPMRDILDEVRQLRDLGYKEITLLGQTVNAYGHDLEKENGVRPDFASLLEAINDVDETLRVRFTSPHPMYFNARLLNTMAALPSVCEHLHMPLQSGDNDCLRRMKRTYTIEKYRGIVERVRETMPGASITTDLIVGFCGESEAEYENTLRAVQEIRFDYAFMFAYSPRHSTAAWDWQDDVPAAEKSRRLTKLVGIQNTISRERNQSLVGQTLEVLVEGASEKNADKLTGRTRSNKRVFFPASMQDYPLGSFAQVRVLSGAMSGLDCEVVSAPAVAKRSMLIELLPA